MSVSAQCVALYVCQYLHSVDQCVSVYSHRGALYMSVSSQCRSVSSQCVTLYVCQYLHSV